MMTESGVIIRKATVDDAEALLRIYAPYVENTAITFEYDVPSLQEFRHRIETILTKYPYIVAQQGDAILGYAYAGTFKGRAAYNWAAEVTIYVDRDAKQKGIGRKLYDALERIAKAQNILNLYACIAYPEADDEHLTKDSVHFHEHMGYKLAGTFLQCGYKFDTWYHMVWMEKMIGEHTSCPQNVVWFENVSAETLNKLGIQA